MDNEEIARKETAKILVVDDDSLLRSFMEVALLSSGYNCISAEDGLAALDLLEKDSFDMVISDIEMPRLNGLELLFQIKKRYPSTKTLIISGKYKRHDTLNGLSARDAHSFLTKPFPLNLFLSTVQTVLLTASTHN
jgi:DNA-binding NtrC family response regulator